VTEYIDKGLGRWNRSVTVGFRSVPMLFENYTSGKIKKCMVILFN